MATGDIGARIATLEFDPNSGNGRKILPVAGEVYVIAYTGPPGQSVRLRTVNIGAAGGISALAFYTIAGAGGGMMGDFINIAGNVYAAAYKQATTFDGYIITVSISDDGLTMANIATVQFEAGTTDWFSFIHVTGDIYAICYCGTGQDGWIKTVTISPDGTSVALTGGVLEFDTGQALFPEIIHIAGNVYGIVYQAPGGYGRLQTITISPDGLTITSITTLPNFELGLCTGNIMRHVNGNIYAIFYRGPSNIGWIRTVSISDDGATLALTGGYLNTGLAMQTPQVFIEIAPNVFAMPYYPGNAKGYVYTYNISNDGLTITQIDYASFSPHNLTSNYLAMALTAGNIYALAWSGYLQDGYVSTIDIDNLYDPSAQTDPATSVEEAAATLNGTLIDDGNEACDCGFEWGETVAYGNTTPTQSRTTGQTFAQTISGLDPHKTYHFRAFATNSVGTSYGADRTFLTLGVALPTATTDPASALSAIAATPNGTLDDDGGEACDCGFEWGLDTGYGTTTPTESKTTGEPFSQVIGGLFPNTTYHFRAFAINEAGTSYGADRSFTTALVISRAFALARREL